MAGLGVADTSGAGETGVGVEAAAGLGITGCGGAWRVAGFVKTSHPRESTVVLGAWIGAAGCG